ncbi:MAG TPA: hypothetical protein PKC18_01330, partial [Lacipirellulaceae bacterium]|nr:hypothetical protein [Lacipirellulaceae bacterium]
MILKQFTAPANIGAQASRPSASTMDYESLCSEVRGPSRSPDFRNPAMLSRTVTVPTLLAASVAVPYAATNAPQWR